MMAKWGSTLAIQVGMLSIESLKRVRCTDVLSTTRVLSRLGFERLCFLFGPCLDLDVYDLVGPSGFWANACFRFTWKAHERDLGPI